MGKITFQQHKEKLKRLLTASLQKSADNILVEIKNTVPVVSGRLKNSYTLSPIIDVAGIKYVQVTSDVKYAAIIEYGDDVRQSGSQIRIAVRNEKSRIK